MDRVMGPLVPSVTDDDQSEQPAPVFYYDLKEGRRIDFNVLIRAHNTVYRSHIRADSSSDENSEEAEDDGDDGDDDEDDDDEDGDDVDEDNAEAVLASSTNSSSAAPMSAIPSASTSNSSLALASTTSSTAPVLITGPVSKKRKVLSSARRSKELDYDSDDSFIDDGDLSDSIESFGSKSGPTSDSEEDIVLPSDIQALIDKIQTDFAADFEKLRSQKIPRFAYVESSKSLLVQVYQLIKKLPSNSTLRRTATAKLTAMYAPLTWQSIQGYAKQTDSTAPGTTTLQTTSSSIPPAPMSSSSIGTSSSNSTLNAPLPRVDQPRSNSTPTTSTSSIRYAPLPLSNPWSDSRFIPLAHSLKNKNSSPLPAAAALVTTTKAPSLKNASSLNPVMVVAGPPLRVGANARPGSSGSPGLSLAEPIEINDDDGCADGDSMAMSVVARTFQESQQY